MSKTINIGALVHQCLNTTSTIGLVLQDSITASGDRISTFDTEYPRFIHSEVMTHRVLSRNAASSRAIPIAKNIEQVKHHMAHPIHWGQNEAGMQANAELPDDKRVLVEQDWERAAQFMCYIADRFQTHGAHKQLSNRVLETFVHMKTIITTTEISNFMSLRDHKDAQPEFQALAASMRDALEASKPLQLREGEAHVPYVTRIRNEEGVLEYFVGDVQLTLAEAMKVSASACAQVSYRVLDLGLDKALKIYDRLVGSFPVHASPFEHQAIPIERPLKSLASKNWPEGITHMDRNGDYWSGNFKGWAQHRHLLGKF